MESAFFQNWFNVAAQPAVRLVAMFDESVESDRIWTLPFHALSLCVRDDGADPSWAELPESGRRMPFKPGAIHFTFAGTPMRLRYTTANRHLCIHFRCEVFPGVDALAGVRGRFLVETDGPLAAAVRAAFADPDPVRRLARAESAALAAALPFWPARSPVDPVRAAPFESAMREIRETVDARTDVAALAARTGWSGTRFSRAFRAVFGMPPKRWLDRAVRLLADPARSVKDVAYALDFSTEFNFSRFVKRVSGLPPTKLRTGFPGPLLVRN
jgi:AraC-like DNA-binding protein